MRAPCDNSGYFFIRQAHGHGVHHSQRIILACTLPPLVKLLDGVRGMLPDQGRESVADANSVGTMATGAGRNVTLPVSFIRQDAAHLQVAFADLHRSVRCFLHRKVLCYRYGLLFREALAMDTITGLLRVPLI